MLPSPCKFDGLIADWIHICTIANSYVHFAGTFWCWFEIGRIINMVVLVLMCQLYFRTFVFIDSGSIICERSLGKLLMNENILVYFS